LEGARVIAEIRAGTWERKRLNREAIDDFNARAVRNRRTFTMRQVEYEFDTAHKGMEEIVAALPEDVDESSTEYKWVEGVTFKHHAHHAAQIEQYRKDLTES
jgi:hypothetical protein